MTPETDLQLATLHDAVHGLREGLACLRGLISRRSAQELAEAFAAEDDAPDSASDDWPPPDQREPPRDPVWATPNLANVPAMEPLARAMGLRPDLKSSAAAA